MSQPSGLKSIEERLVWQLTSLKAINFYRGDEREIDYVYKDLYFLIVPVSVNISTLFMKG